jgi:hypothetical protein
MNQGESIPAEAGLPGPVDLTAEGAFQWHGMTERDLPPYQAAVERARRAWRELDGDPFRIILRIRFRGYHHALKRFDEKSWSYCRGSCKGM